jgi:hypothetical protein
MSTRNVIVLKGDLAHRTEEYVCGATNILPGMLVARDSAGLLIPHGTAGGTFVSGEVAVEYRLLGKTVDDAYVAGDLVQTFIAQPGDVVQLILNAEENAAINSKLSSNGDGTVQVVATTEGVTFEALEALDLTGLSDTRIPARRI